MTSTYVDGDMFVADGGALVRYVTGKSDGWDPKAPKDTVLRPAPFYSIVAGGTARPALDGGGQRVGPRDARGKKLDDLLGLGPTLMARFFERLSAHRAY
jgi:hypothetical protein